MQTDPKTLAKMNECLLEFKKFMTDAQFSYTPISLRLRRDMFLKQYLREKTYHFSLDWEQACIGNGFGGLDGTRGQHKDGNDWRWKLGLKIMKLLRL